MTWPRADPVELAKFDTQTKCCTMNCGKHGLDPRSREERLFLCDDCDTVRPTPPNTELETLRHQAALYRYVREQSWYIDSAADAMGMIPPRKAWADKPPRPDWDEVEEALEGLISGRDEHVSEYQ